MLLNLDEIQAKVVETEEKVKGMDESISGKLKDLEKMLESSESRKEVLKEVDDL